ncbi:MAG: hypothetical protein HY704_14750 [Gemmatimonadetes bacterium]|nr:hypothetical protein [Gemmatimonadota bacterium]
MNRPGRRRAALPTRAALAFTLLAAAGPLLGGACGGGRALPPPRPIIVHSGIRIVPDSARLERVDEWLRRAMENIEKDPTFLIEVQPRDTAPLPWDGLEIQGDTAKIGAPRDVPEAAPVLMVYAHLRLMARMGRQAEWLPEAPDARGWELERAVVRRLCDAWLYARTIADAPPYDRLDELLYACEFGYLEAFVLTARAGDFGEERERWLRENPGAADAYRRWFQQTFGKDPPGWKGAG